jgi:hypothetical protein
MTTKSVSNSVSLDVRTLLLVAFLLTLIAALFIFNSQKAGAVQSVRAVESLAGASYQADPT